MMSMVSNDPNAQKLSKEIARQVLDARTEKGLSKNKLSQMSGLSRQAILYIETMQRSPSVETLYVLAKALEIPLWQLLKDAEERI